MEMMLSVTLLLYRDSGLSPPENYNDGWLLFNDAVLWQRFLTLPAFIRGQTGTAWLGRGLI